MVFLELGHAGLQGLDGLLVAHQVVLGPGYVFVLVGEGELGLDLVLEPVSL